MIMKEKKSSLFDATDILEEEGCNVKHIKEFNHNIRKYLERVQIL